MGRKLLEYGSFKTCVGFLSGNNKYAWRAYKERADVARKRNVGLVQIVPQKDLDLRIANGDRAHLRYWDGKSMHELSEEIPQVIYDRLNISDKRRSKIVDAMSKTGISFINPPEFRGVCADKVKAYSVFIDGGIATPETHVFSAECLEDILEKKGFAFVKKRVSSQGKNQVVIRELGKQDYLIIPSSNNQLQRVNGFNSVLQYLSQSDIGEDYLVQEGIYVDRLDGRAYDFRALFQRGSQGHLGMTCFYVRVGAPSSEQANIGKKGHPQDPYVVFEDYEKIKRDINKLGRKVVNAFSKDYSVGEIGIDFVLSEDGNLVVIEANSKPGSKGIRTLREWNPLDEQYHNRGVIPYEYNNQIRGKWGKSLDLFLSRPILYAKHLCNGEKNE
jgi:glutathione synthase/RimK-type ligase-like ATP-grasp enzyme